MYTDGKGSKIMEQLKHITYPLALLAGGLLLSPLNKGPISYILVVIAALSLAIGLWSDRNYDRKQTLEKLIAKDESKQAFINLLKQQTKDKIEQDEHILQEQQAMFKEYLSVSEQLLKEQQKMYEATKSNWLTSQKQQSEVEENKQTILLSLKGDLHTLLERIHKDLTSLEQIQETMATKQRKQSDEQVFLLKENHLETIHSLENIVKQLNKQQEAKLSFEKIWKEEQDKIIEHLYTIEKYEKGKEQALEDLLDNQEDSHRQMLEIVEEGFIDIDEDLTDYTIELQSYRTMLEKSVQQIEKLNEVLDEQYLQVLEGIHASVHSLEKSNELFQGKIDEIASSKMEERKAALEMQDNLLKRLKQ